MLLLFVVFGAAVLAFTLATVNRRGPNDVDTSSHLLSRRERYAVTWWLERGYFHTGGMMVHPDMQNNPLLYRSAVGGDLISGFLLEKIWIAITGHPNWHLLDIHNQVVSMLTSALLGLLGFRLARRFGLPWLHSFTLGIVLQAVYFTFPDNLWIYWEMSARGWWLPFACVFLLLDERLADGEPNRIAMIAQPVAAFLMTYMEYVAATAFLGSYVITSLLLSERRPNLKRLALITVIPLFAALALFQTQLAVAKRLNPQMPIQGQTFMYRSGLDGDTTYYGGHLDIAYRRDTARANWQPPSIRPLLFHWPSLFFTSVAALVFMIISAMRGRVPWPALVSVFSLLGAYLIYGAVFSQAFVIHPYFYDMMLFTPLMIVLFIVTPGLIEPMVSQRGLLVVVAVFLGIWVSMVQLRIFAIWYPTPKQEQKIGARRKNRAPVEQRPGGPLPQVPDGAQEGRAVSL